MVGVLATGQDGLEREHNQPSDMSNKAQKQGREQQASRVVAESFESFIRGIMKQKCEEMMLEEVVLLCGQRYRPIEGAKAKRAGSEKGTLRYRGESQEVRRPRVRTLDGREEIGLESYQQISAWSNHHDMITGLLAEGLSGRGAARAIPEGPRKSTLSEAWIESSRAELLKLRERDLSEKHWVAVFIDGVFLRKDVCAVVAVGLDDYGRKQVLDFEMGSSESYQVAVDMLRRCRARGFEAPAGSRLLGIADGASALHKALRKHWPDIILQQCLVHAERHLLERLRKGDKPEAQELIKRLRLAHGTEAACEAFDELCKFVQPRHIEAYNGLNEAKERLIAVHGLELGETLQRSLLSTNAIENTFRNFRQSSAGVNRWRSGEDMASRWIASGLLRAERGFHRIRGHQAMPRLIEALKRRESERPGGGDRKIGASPMSSSLRSESTGEAPILRHKCVASAQKTTNFQSQPSA
jgi:transposase-like protein